MADRAHGEESHVADKDGRPQGDAHVDRGAPAGRQGLVEPAKTSAVEKLGESERAVKIATNWVRAKVERGQQRVRSRSISC